MKEITGDLFQQDCDAICITTNGFLKKNGEAVMGRGCALTACKLWPNMKKLVGHALHHNGNKPTVVKQIKRYDIVTFPVKPASIVYNGSNIVGHQRKYFDVGDTVPGWAAKASLEIIEQSAHALVQLADEHGWDTVVIPRPGCGAGELGWPQVKPVLEPILDDRFSIITFN